MSAVAGPVHLPEGRALIQATLSLYSGAARYEAGIHFILAAVFVRRIS